MKLLPSILLPISFVLFGVSIAFSCSEEASAPTSSIQWDCEGVEQELHDTYMDCWSKAILSGDYCMSQNVKNEACLQYAHELYCKRVEPIKLCPQKELDNCKQELCKQQKQCKKAVEQATSEAKFEQQELRFWKRCGVIKPNDHDQWAECEGMEGAADAACSPLYHTEIDPEWCSGYNKELWERMQRDGVTWINCKEGEVCP